MKKNGGYKLLALSIIHRVKKDLSEEAFNSWKKSEWAGLLADVANINLDDLNLGKELRVIRNSCPLRFKNKEKRACKF